MTTLIAIDPPGCGCTECIIGQYVPLNHATPENIAAMLSGQLSNHTGVELRLTVVRTERWQCLQCGPTRDRACRARRPLLGPRTP